MRRNDVASTSFRRRVPTRFLINQCQIITFLIIKYDIIENSRMELRGIVLPVQGGWIIGGANGYVAPPPLKLLGGLAPLPPPPPTSSYAYALSPFLSGKSTCTMFALCPHHWFLYWSDKRVKHRGYEYESQKNAIGQLMWRQCETMFPQLVGKVLIFILLVYQLLNNII